MMLSIHSIIMSTYDESRDILSLLNAIHHKVKSESKVGELVVDYNSPVCYRRVMEEELAIRIWTLQGITTIPMRAAIDDYENDSSLGEGIDDKNYLIKITHWATLRYGLISGLSLKGIRKSLSFFSRSSRFCSVGEKMLLDKLFRVVFITKWFACKYLMHLCQACTVDIAITPNSLQNKIWTFRKKFGGGTRLLPFRSLF